jgi:hypothetical protein
MPFIFVKDFSTLQGQNIDPNSALENQLANNPPKPSTPISGWIALRRAKSSGCEAGIERCD